MDNQIYNGVLTRNKSDERNYKLAQFIPQNDRNEKEEFCLELPETIDIVINQYSYSACVGHAFASAVKLLTYQRTHKWVDIDPFVIYGTRNDMGRGNTYRGKGMYLDDAAYTVHHEGAFLRRDFGEQAEAPKIIDMVIDFKRENPNLVEAARNFCIEGYAWLDTNNPEEIKSALLKGMPVVCSYMACGDSGFSCDQYGYVIYPDKGEDRGLHCMVIIGWTKDDHWIVLNSWGNNKGKRGMLYIDFRKKIYEAIAISETICPIKRKATFLALKAGRRSILFKDTNVTTDEEKELEIAPFIYKNRMYVPIRFIAEYLGAAVEWDAKNNMATIVSEENIIKLQSNNNKMQIINAIGATEKTMDTAPIIRQDRMFLPLRYIAEELNCTVSYDDATGVATIQAR